MATCTNCTICASVLKEDGLYYLIGNMGPDIISVIENDLGHEVDEDSSVCANCFTNILQKIPSPVHVKSEFQIEQDIKLEVQQEQDRNICVWCQCSLLMKRTHDLPEGLERYMISQRISPREIPDGSLVCWLRVKKLLQQQAVKVEVIVETDSPKVKRERSSNNCVWCLRSLNRRRRHPLPDGPERDEIVARIHPREIPPGVLVCYACWVAAHRNVQRSANTDDTRQDNVAQLHRNVDCVVCGMSLFRRRARTLFYAADRDKVAEIISPRELPKNALLCTSCYAQTVENVEDKPVQPPKMTAMKLDNFTHTTSSSTHCFVPHCTNSERLCVLDKLQKQVLTSKKVFITKNSRICHYHKSLSDWEFLDQHQFSSSFSPDELESMLNLSVQEIS